MSRASASDRLRLATLAPHARRHAEMLVWEFPLLQISSAYRNPAQNRRAGGAVNSFHMQRRAVDLIGPEWDLRKAADWCWTARVGPACTGPEEVLLESLGGRNAHLHVAW